MKFEIEYSSEALNDMDRVWMEVWEASKDIDAADKYISDLRAVVRSKNKFPKSGTPLIYMGEFTGAYYLAFKEYLIFYKITETKIEVGRILFSRSDYMKTLFGKSEYIFKDQDD